jgi:hypothetical protein
MLALGFIQPRIHSSAYATLQMFRATLFDDFVKKN